MLNCDAEMYTLVDIAGKSGMSLATVHSHKKKGAYPLPDLVAGRVSYWTREHYIAILE